uniref:Uncharacterized protein n=1 Tax=Mesocestoides corti TaxID=53468 RepID=A0A5K3F7E8_MESCO
MRPATPIKEGNTHSRIPNSSSYQHRFEYLCAKRQRTSPNGTDFRGVPEYWQ